jgi:hypothetical protein
VNDGKNGKRVAERPMDDMPEMKHLLRLAEKNDAL